MTIQEANNKLIRIGNAMLTEKYCVVPRITTEEVKILDYIDGFDSIEEAFDYAMKLKPDWKINT